MYNIIAEFIENTNKTELTDKIILNGRTFYFRTEDKNLDKIIHIVNKMEPLEVWKETMSTFEHKILATWLRYSEVAIEELVDGIGSLIRKARSRDRLGVGEIICFRKQAWVYNTRRFPF